MKIEEKLLTEFCQSILNGYESSATIGELFCDAHSEIHCSVVDDFLRNRESHPSQPSEEEIKKEIQRLYPDEIGENFTFHIEGFWKGVEFAQQFSNKPLLNDEEIEEEALKRYPKTEEKDVIDVNEYERGIFTEGVKFAQQSSGVNKELLEGLKGLLELMDDHHIQLSTSEEPKREKAEQLINKLEKK